MSHRPRLLIRTEELLCPFPHLDSVAAYSGGSSEASALLACQHKQLCKPLLH